MILLKCGFNHYLVDYKENDDWIELKVGELNAFDVLLVQYADLN